MCTWLGPPAHEGSVVVGPVRIERWRKQPRRTLLFGRSSEGRTALGPGLLASAAVSKGHPAERIGRGEDAETLFVGVRLQLRIAAEEGAVVLGRQQVPLQVGKHASTSSICTWYAPCDVKITLLGERKDLARTVRWVFTPACEEIFFGVLPLSEVEKHYVTSSGSLQVRAELHFHWAAAADSRPAPLPAGAHSPVLRALVLAWCLAGPAAVREAAAGGWRDVGRDGPAAAQAKQARQAMQAKQAKCSGTLRLVEEASTPPALAPGLLAPCMDLPSAFAQEIIPGLMIASEGVMTKLVELHDVGVGVLLEVSTIWPGQAPSAAAPGFAVRLLRLRGSGDTVELVEDSACTNDEIRQPHVVVDFIERALKGVLSGAPGAWHALLFPRALADAGPCAALAAVVVARSFGLAFAAAAGYVQSRWDVAIDAAWPERFAQAGEDMLPAEAWAPTAHVDSSRSNSLLEVLAETFRRAAPPQDLAAAFAAWLAAPGAARCHLSAARAWETSWQPCLGECIRVHDVGWGSAKEIFRALSAGDEALKGTVVTLRLMDGLNAGEVFEVPHRIEHGEDTWHLVALICSSGIELGLASRPQYRAFLHGSSEWMLDSDGRLHDLTRQVIAGAAPDHWLCTNDAAPRAAVYLRHCRAEGMPPTPTLPRGVGVAAPAQGNSREVVPHGRFVLRVVTEKLLQQADGNFEGGVSVEAAVALTLPCSIDLPTLQESVHEVLKIPPERQLLLHLPDRPSDDGTWRICPLASPPYPPNGADRSMTILLLFRPEGSSGVMNAGVAEPFADLGPPLQVPLLCKFFDQGSSQYVVLGVLLASPTCTLHEHTAWLQKRSHLALNLASNGVAGVMQGAEMVAPVYACYMDRGSRGMVALRLDWPLWEQHIAVGSTLVFEAAACGRQVCRPLESGSGGVVAALAQLVQPPSPVQLLGCVSLEGDVSAQRSKSLDAWGLLQRSLREATEGEVAFEQVHVPQEGLGALRADVSSTLVFRVLLDGNMRVAGRLAVQLCTRFARSEDTAGRADRRPALCRGKLARLHPQEMCLIAWTVGGAAKALWRAAAPGLVATTCAASSDAEWRGGEVPSRLLAAVASLGGPVGEVETFEIEAGKYDGSEANEAIRAEHRAAQLLLEEPVLPIGVVRRRRNRLVAPTKTSVDNLPAPGLADADAQEVETTGGEYDVSAGELRAETASPQLTGQDASPAPEEEAKTAFGPQLHSFTLPAAATSCLRQFSRERVGSIEECNGVQFSECPHLASTGICFDGVRCAHVHATGTLLVRPEPCPFRSESRDTCPLRSRCVFAHGDSERQCPPYIRMRLVDETSQASTPVGRRSPSKCDASAAGVVTGMLASCMEQLAAVMAQAKALNLVDEVTLAEKQLINHFLQRPGVVRRDSKDGTATRGSMSRASSAESFFDEQAARLMVDSTFTPGEATQPSTPRSLIHTPGARPMTDGRHWFEVDSLDAPGPDVAATMLPLTRVTAPVLPMVSQWYEPMTEASSPQPLYGEDSAPPDHAPRAPLEFGPVAPGGGAGGAIGHLARDFTRAREEVEQQPRDRHLIRPPSRLDRRPSGGIGGQASSLPNLGFMWHSSPFCISRTPNIHTPVSHCSPARSPTSISGYCSPIAGLQSGVASPNQRRSQSGYSSPSAAAGTFYVDTHTAQSGLMRRLMSLREARGEEREDDDEYASDEEAREQADAGEIDLLECLLQRAQCLPLGGSSKVATNLCFDLSSDFMSYSRRGLVASRSAPFLNAFLQAMLPCAPLMHLFAQLSWHTLSKQRPAYACFVQIAFHFFGSTRGGPSDGAAEGAMHGVTMQLGVSPVDAGAYAEALLRRFERQKVAPPTSLGTVAVGTLPRFVHFVLGQLHDECKWPTLSPIAGYYEDSPVARIFGGRVRTGARQGSAGAGPQHAGLMGAGSSNTEPFIVLHLDWTSDSCTSVSESVEHLLQHAGAHFRRLPPILLLHLQRFRTVDGVLTKVSRHCQPDLRLELEEASNCMLRTVSYELRSVVCHYGECPEGGSYKALVRQCKPRPSRGPNRAAHSPSLVDVGAAAAGPTAAGAAAPSAGGATTAEWYVCDDAAVRPKQAEEWPTMVQMEGYHVCFLMYRREDTKTINMRPHAV